MAEITCIRIPVCSGDGVIIERIDSARARRLSLASNATVVRARKHGAIVRIMLGSVGDDSLENAKVGDPRRYTFLDKSDAMPFGVHTLRYLPKSTAGLYRQSVNDCIKLVA